MKYKVIYADPAWTYTLWGKSSGKSASDKYTVMSIDDMKALPVQSIAHDDCVLLMWATYPNLLEAIELGQAWGFDYKTCAFTWVKKTTTGKHWHMGMGYTTRANAEPCLLFSRGKPSRKSKGVKQLIDSIPETENVLSPALIAPIMRHSAKPIEAYYRIEQLYEGDYVELFARSSRKGWVSLGYDIDGRDLRESIPALANGVLPTRDDSKKFRQPVLNDSQIARIRSRRKAKRDQGQLEMFR